jgi:hypothetical protein
MQSWSIRVFQLCLRSLVEALFLHTERQLISLHHYLVSAKTLVEHLLVLLLYLLVLLFRLLNCALLQIVIHQLVALVKHRLGDGDH